MNITLNFYCLYINKFANSCLKSCKLKLKKLTNKLTSGQKTKRTYKQSKTTFGGDGGGGDAGAHKARWYVCGIIRSYANNSII